MQLPRTHYMLVDGEGRIWSGGSIDDGVDQFSDVEADENEWLGFVVAHLDELKQVEISEAAWERIFLVSGPPEDFNAFDPATYRHISEFVDILVI